MQDSFLNSPLVFSIALTLIHFIWQGALIALVLKTALIFIPTQKSQLRYACSAGAMLLNFFAPFVTFFIIYKPTSLQFSQHLAESEATAAIYTQLTAYNSWQSSFVEYLPYLTFIWLCVISILSLKLFIELYSVTQLHKQNVLPPEQELFERFELLAKEVGLKYTPNLLLSNETHVPMAIGWLKPIVLLPVSMLSGLTPAQLDMLMLHELAHIRRYDYFVNLIQSIVEIILFFHPAVLWVSNQMRNEREFCSDDIAVKHSGNPIAYAHTLADTAVLCNKHRKHSIPTMAIAASGGDLTQRVLRLVNHHHCASSNQVSKWFASLIVISLLLVSTSQQLSNFLKLDIKTATYTPVVEVIDTHITPVVATTKEKSSEFNTIPSRLAEDDITPEEREATKAILEHQNKMEQLRAQAPILKQDKEVLIQNESSITSNSYSEIEKQLAVDEPTINNVLNDFQTKSSSEIAFEKIDSEKKGSNNIYVQQITELTTDLAKEIEVQQIEATDKEELVATPVIEKEKPVFNRAELLFSIPPKYPVLAKRKGIEIEVKVSFVIDTDGFVKDLSFPVVKRHRNYFKNSVRNALNKWRFIPAYKDGKAVESKMSKIFSFSLHE